MVSHCNSSTGRPKLEEFKFKASLSYTERPCFKKEKKKLKVLLVIKHTGANNTAFFKCIVNM
jgi:hypothetical protein